MKAFKAFFKSRLNTALLLGIIVQGALLATGKTTFDEGTATALASNVITVLYRIGDSQDKEAVLQAATKDPWK